MIRSLLAAAVVAVWTASAVAQVNPFGRNIVGLNEADIQLMVRTAEGLYRAKAPVKHAQATWRNPDTGNAGAVVIAEVSTAPRLCASIAHRYRIAGQADPKTFMTKRCRTGSGAWELVLE